MEKEVLTPATVISRNPELVHSEIDGEVVMMSVDSGKYYSLDRIGSRIWELLEDPVSISVLVERLLREFQVERQTCVEDVIAFLRQLDDDDMLKIH